MDDLDQKLTAERDRLVQQLAGLCDALMCATPEHLADVLPLVAALDAVVTQVRALGVPVTTEFPDEVELPVDTRVLARLFGGASLIRNN
jgi:hypothetical protein